jgi:NADH:ubiquinone oxidoreductase subunit 5 (subunit L)/multisubunit Na+/H+ antiporter MnhA subunit
MLASLFLLAAIATMAMGAMGLFIMRDQGPTFTLRRWSEFSSWTALGFGILFGIQVFTTPSLETSGYLYSGNLQAILVPYILLMGVLVMRFAYHYLQTDRNYAFFFLKIKLLICSLLLFVVLNHALFLLFAWIVSGWILYFLIAHTGTQSAMNSAKMALKRFIAGDLLVATGFLLLIIKTGSFYLTDWVSIPSPLTETDRLLPLAFIAVGTLSKTALIPFHKWLAHTLTAPTPVSAIMHAGFVNSGAILLAKISPLIILQPEIMAFIFTVGLASALFGSVVMLVQTDVKRYLTFSTVGQMGFMMMECGLGAFHLAILHLIIHGFFKARLFLSAGRVIEHRQAIRNVKLQQARHSKSEKAFIFNLKTGIAVLLVLSTTWFLVFQVAFLKQYLLQLPAILLSVLALATLFIQSALVKAKGTGIKGVGIALVFSMFLVVFYVLYEISAQAFFPGLNLISSVKNSEVLYTGTYFLIATGVLAWLVYLKLLPLPSWLKQKCYVYLLNAAGIFKTHSTFSNRHQSAQLIEG